MSRPQPPFYMDLGETPVLEDEEGHRVELDRYAIWSWDAGKGKHQVAKTAPTLKELQDEFGPWPVVHLMFKGIN